MDWQSPTPAPPPGGLADRVATLEQRVGELADKLGNELDPRLSSLERELQANGYTPPSRLPQEAPSMNCVSCGQDLYGKWVSDDRQCTVCVDAAVPVPSTPVAPKEGDNGAR